MTKSNYERPLLTDPQNESAGQWRHLRVNPHFRPPPPPPVTRKALLKRPKLPFEQFN